MLWLLTMLHPSRGYAIEDHDQFKDHHSNRFLRSPRVFDHYTSNAESSYHLAPQTKQRNMIIELVLPLIGGENRTLSKQLT